MVWRGWGIWVFLFWLFWLVVLAVSKDSLGSIMPQGLTDDMSFQWVLGAVCIPSAATTFLLVWYRRSHPLAIVDPESNVTVLVPRIDDLFFIPMIWWIYIQLAVAVVLLGATEFGILLVNG